MRSLSMSTAVPTASLAWPAAGQEGGATIALTGLDGRRATLSIAGLDALPRVAVQVEQHGTTLRYEGALLADVLAKVGVPRGKAIHGAELTDVVLVQARDNYKVALDPAGTDAVTRKERVVLADRMDGAPLDAKQGPFNSLSKATFAPPA